MAYEYNEFQTIPLLKVIPEGQIKQYLNTGLMNITSYGLNEIIHFDGDYCDSLEIILHGNVIVERIDESGHLMTVASFSHGNCVGGNLLFSQNPYYPMTVTAKKPSTVLLISKKAVFDLCTANEDFLQLFLQVISDHTILLGAKIKYYVNRSIRDIIITYLTHEAERQATNPIQLESTKKALAERMGIQRTSLSRELQKMEKEGLIAVNGKLITLRKL